MLAFGSLVLAGCHSEPEPAPVAPIAAPAPEAQQAPAGDTATLGDLFREDEWRQRTADKLRRNP